MQPDALSAFVSMDGATYQVWLHFIIFKLVWSGVFIPKLLLNYIMFGFYGHMPNPFRYDFVMLASVIFRTIPRLIRCRQPLR